MTAALAHLAFAVRLARLIHTEVRGYLAGPTQEQFDALVIAGCAREQADFEAWQRELAR